MTTVDEASDRLHRAGWAAAAVCLGATWLVPGRNGENSVLATGAIQTEAWQRALGQAAAVGMPATRRPST